MERLGKAVIAAGMLALASGACFSDPTSDLRGDASRIVFSRSYVLQAPGDTDQVNITLLDDQGNAVAFDDPTLASANAAVADIAPLPDSTLRRIPGNTLYKAIVTGEGPGQTFVRVTAGGVTDSIAVVVTPVTLAVTFAPAAPVPGDTVTITVTEPGVTFSSTATAAFGSGTGFYQFLSRSATELKYRAGASGAGSVTITGAVLLGSIPLSPTGTASNLTVAEANEPADDAPTTGPVITIPAGWAVGDTVKVYGSVDDVSIDDWWRFTSGAADSVEIVVDWGNAGADVDAILGNATGGFVYGFPGATGAHPERIRRRLIAATGYTILIEMYDTHGIPMPTGYRIAIIRRA